MSDLNELLAKLSQSTSKPPQNSNSNSPSPFGNILQGTSKPNPGFPTFPPPNSSTNSNSSPFANLLAQAQNNQPAPPNNSSLSNFLNQKPSNNSPPPFDKPTFSKPPSPPPSPPTNPPLNPISKSSPQENNYSIPDLSLNFLPTSIQPTQISAPVKESTVNVVAQEFSKEGELKITNVVRYDPYSHQSIQSLIDNSRIGTLIEIPTGNYNEEITILKQVHLRGIGDVTIKGKGVSDTIHITSKFVILENLNIIQTETRGGGALTITTGFARILNCSFSSETISAVQVLNQSKVEIYGSVLSDSHNPAMMITETSQAFCKDCEFKNSKTFGFLANDSTNVTFESCKFHHNTSSGVNITSSASMTCKQSYVYSNDNCGFEITSTGSIIIHQTTIRDHLQGTGLLASGNVKPQVLLCTFMNNQLAAIKASNGSQVKSEQNVFIDAEQNVLLLSHENATILTNDDSYSGKCISALAVFDNGKIKGKNIKINNVSNTAILAYEGGEIDLDGVNISKTGGVGIQVRDRANFILNSAIITGSSQLAVSILSNATGSMNDCQIINGETVGLEVSSVSSFTFTNCQFSSNKVAGSSLHVVLSVVFNNCRFDTNSQFGVDITGKNAAPIFNKCQFTTSNEAGINITNLSQPKFSNCLISDQVKVGISIINASPIFNDSEITSTGVVAVSISGGAQPFFQRCNIHDNNSLAIQAHETNTYARFIESFLVNQMNSVAILAINNCTVECIKCKLEGSLHPHCEIRDGSTVILRQSEITGSSKGVGLQCHSGGILKVDNSFIHDETKLAVMIGDKGYAEIINSKISGCGVCGLLALQNSKLKVQNTLLDSNGQFSMQFQGNAEAEVFDCTIQNHSTFGWVMSPQSQVDYSGNKFSSNGQKDIFVN